MRVLFFLVATWLILLANYGFSQTKHTLVDTTQFKLDTTIKQNRSVFKFWRGNSDTTWKIIIIERVSKRGDTILYNDRVRDGEYDISDMNEDGFRDFVTYYHEHPAIHFFNPLKNNFDSIAIGWPSSKGSIETTKATLYYDFNDAIYGSPYANSTLYKYIGKRIYYYYEIKYMTADTYEGTDSALKVNLYKFKKGEYNDEVFLKEIKTPHPNKFDYAKYWQQHYKQLLGHQ